MNNLLLMFTTAYEESIYDSIGIYEDFGESAAAIFVLIWLGIMAISLLNYILFSIGLYGVAKNHGIESAGLAWVPVARQWVKGSIVDYHSKCKEKPTKWHVILPIFAILPVLCFIVMYIAMFVMIFAMEPDGILYDRLDAQVLTALIVFFSLYIAVIIVTLLNSISNIICDYKIFEEVNPRHAVLFTFLSYLLPFAQGICLIACKKYGTGVKQEVYQPVFTPDPVSSVSVFEPAQVQTEPVINEVTEPTAEVVKEATETFENTVEETVEAIVEETVETVEEVTEASIEEVTEAPAEEATPIDDSDIFTE